MNEEKKTIDNEVCLAGVIVNRFEMNRMIRVTLRVPEDSRRDEAGNPVTNFPEFIVFKNNDNTSMVDNFLKHDAVKITGHFSSNARSLQEADTYKQQQVVADTVEEITRYYPNAVGNEKGRGYMVFQNNFIVSGEIVRIAKTSTNVKLVDILTVRDNHKNVVRLTVFGNRDGGVQIGDTVTIHGRIRTTRKEGADGKGRFYQNLVFGYMSERNGERVTRPARRPVATAAKAETTTPVEPATNEPDDGLFAVQTEV